MDFSQITGLMGGLSSAVELGKAALSVRDSNQLAVVLSQMNDKLLDTQQRLLLITTESIALQDQLTKTQQKNLEMEAALKQRSRYVLSEVAKGQFAYKSKVEPASDVDPSSIEPLHFACQPCLDKGQRGVLGIEEGSMRAINYTCPLCRREIYTGTSLALFGPMA